jgi:hypothetical protein
MEDLRKLLAILVVLWGEASGSLEFRLAHLAELVDALGLGSSDSGRGGSSPPVGIEVRGRQPGPLISQWLFVMCVTQATRPFPR